MVPRSFGPLGVSNVPSWLPTFPISSMISAKWLGKLSQLLDQAAYLGTIKSHDDALNLATVSISEMGPA